MTTLTLVDPQSMETLPKSGRAFIDYTQHGKNPEFDSRVVTDIPLPVLRRYIGSKHYTFHAWSRTATFGEGDV